MFYAQAPNELSVMHKNTEIFFLFFIQYNVMFVDRRNLQLLVVTDLFKSMEQRFIFETEIRQ